MKTKMKIWRIILGGYLAQSIHSHMLVYEIAWVAVVFGINCAGRRLVIERRRILLSELGVTRYKSNALRNILLLK